MPVFSHSAGGIVLNPRGEILVVQQRDGTWSFPKGKINKGETPWEAAIREVREESGLTDVQLIRILKSYVRFAMRESGGEDTGKIKRITMYFFKTKQTETSPMDPRVSKTKWVTCDEAMYLLAHPKDQEFLQAVQEDLAALSVA